MQFPFERSHERDQSRDRPNAGAPGEPRQGAEALLRAHQALTDLRAVFPRREQRYTQEVQKHGRQELWLPLIVLADR